MRRRGHHVHAADDLADLLLAPFAVGRPHCRSDIVRPRRRLARLPGLLRVGTKP